MKLGYGEVGDMLVVASFLVWAEDQKSNYGGYSAEQALAALCRILAINLEVLRRVVLGPTSSVEEEQ